MSDILSFRSATEDTALAAGALDWGSAPRGSADQRAFRVRNDSAVYTATGVVVSITDTGAVATPSQAACHLVSRDASQFSATVDIGDLPPLAVSGLITLRRVTPTTAQTGTFTYRIVASPTSWQ